MSAASPRCYFAVYADPTVGDHVTVEGGMYGNRAMPRELKAGDMVLIYCTSSYPGRAKTAPGIGIAKSVDHARGTYTYDYLPFQEPAPLELLRLAFTEDDRRKLLEMRHAWLFEISSESFRAVAGAVRLGR